MLVAVGLEYLWVYQRINEIKRQDTEYTIQQSNIVGSTMLTTIPMDNNSNNHDNCFRVEQKQQPTNQLMYQRINEMKRQKQRVHNATIKRYSWFEDVNDSFNGQQQQQP